MDKTRCHWFDKSNDILRKYHDEEFGILNKDDDYLFEETVISSWKLSKSPMAHKDPKDNIKEIIANPKLQIPEKISELPLTDSMWKR